jgi:hypothetical protein
MIKRILAFGAVLFALLLILSATPWWASAQQIARFITIEETSQVALDIGEMADSLDNIEDNLATDATHGDAVTLFPDGPMVMGEAKLMDGEPENTVEIGQAARVAIDTAGRTWTRPGGVCAAESRLQTVAIDTAASGNVELVALNSGDIVYVCGYDLVADGAVAVQFIYGTGTACATGETDLSGPMSFAANGGISVANTGVVQFKSALSNALCIENSTTGGVRGILKYVRTAAP